ncbi:MAG: hypothetical protein HUK15_03410 [Bacteroidales bacterium]|nr:hypothetical protein [Bacteroidales bacterium]
MKKTKITAKTIENNSNNRYSNDGVGASKRSKRNDAKVILCRNWQNVEKSKKYSKAKGYETTQKIADETMDGIFIKLNDRNEDKSFAVKKRLLRRIVEKRQAQAMQHKCINNHNRYKSSLVNTNTSRCMTHLTNLRHAC